MHEPSSGRKMLGRVVTVTGVSVVASGVLAIRLRDLPRDGIAGLSAWLAELEVFVRWLEDLGLTPIMFAGIATIAAGCGIGAVGAHLCAGAGFRRAREPQAGILDTSCSVPIFVAVAAAAAVGLFVVAGVLDFSSTRVIVPWLTIVFACCVVVARSDRRGLRILKPGLGRLELVSLCCASVVLFAVYAAMSCSWRVSFIGDEYGFFDYASIIAEEGLFSFNWLDGMGVYNDNPRTLSVYQAVWLALLGPSCLAWRLSAAFLTVLCLSPLYLSLRHMAGRYGGRSRSAAAVGCIVFFSSEQIMVWAIQGKIHVAALPPFVFSICLVLAAQVRASAFLYWLSGLACGASFHLSLLGVAVAAPAVALLIGIHTLRRFLQDRRLSMRLLMPAIFFIAGMMILAAPYLVQIDDLRSAVDTKMVHYEGVDSFLARARNSIVLLLQPLDFFARDHFLWGNVIDPVSAFLVCMAFFPGTLRRSTSLLQAAAILGACAVVIGGLSQYTYPSVTRTFLIMVPIAMLASLGFSAIVGPRTCWALGRSRIILVGLCIAAGSLIATFNWVKLWHFNPYQRPQDWHIVAMHEIEDASPQCPVALVFPHEDPRSWLLETMVTIYGYSDRVLITLDDENGLGALVRNLRSDRNRVGQILVPYDISAAGVLMRLSDEHKVPLRFTAGCSVPRPQQSPVLERYLAVIDRLEPAGPNIRR